MFRLFRKIKIDILADGKTGKYFKYALGELVLVVFGILIALQIHNWNEERIEQRQITEFAHALIRDLERDMVMVEPIIIQMEFLQEKIDGLAAYMEGKSVDQIRNIDLFYFMRVPYYRPYAWNRTALEQMKSSGALRQMKNRLLAERISAYDAFTRHLDEDFAYDRQIGSSSSALAYRVVDMNYPNINKVVAIDEQDYFVPLSQFQQVYGDTDLPLLTNDIDEIKVTVNSFLELGGYMGIRARVEIEMPRLVTSARELIELLNAEYRE
jgi:hypothetical protein